MTNDTAALNSAILRAFALRRRFNSKIFGILSFALVISLLVVYILQMQEATEANFNISVYEKKLTDLSMSNQGLEADFLQTNSLANLENILAVSQYEKIDKISYIQILENQMVVKK